MTRRVAFAPPPRAARRGPAGTSRTARAMPLFINNRILLLPFRRTEQPPLADSLGHQGRQASFTLNLRLLLDAANAVKVLANVLALLLLHLHSEFLALAVQL